MPGTDKGQLLEMSGDFDAPLEDFKEYQTRKYIPDDIYLDIKPVWYISIGIDKNIPKRLSWILPNFF